MLADPSQPAEWMRGACAETALPPACPYRPILRESCLPLLDPCLDRLRRPFRKRAVDVIGSSVAELRSQTKDEAGAGAIWLG